jgi:hypothetical protein
LNTTDCWRQFKWRSNPRRRKNFRRISPAFDDEPLLAANDNHTAWPLIPFPEGWYASC